MLEEAMAQLMANQEKIAASEGKGPTWEDKVCRNALTKFLQSNDIFCISYDNARPLYFWFGMWRTAWKCDILTAVLSVFLIVTHTVTAAQKLFVRPTVLSIRSDAHYPYIWAVRGAKSAKSAPVYTARIYGCHLGHP